MSESKKRKYEKRNHAYWNGLSDQKASVSAPAPISTEEVDNWAPTSFQMSTASAYAPGTNRGGTTTTRRNGVARAPVRDDKINLENLPLPFCNKGGRITIREYVEICQRVYANIAIFRNTIDIMTEFSTSDIYLTGGNEVSRTFVTNWLAKIGLPKLQEYFFREYYRSGNVFIYTFHGLIPEEEYRKLKTSFAAKSNKLPIRYTILNPADIVLYASSQYEKGIYRKVLNHYEIEALKEQKTDEDKAIFNALPADIKQKILKSQYVEDGLDIPITNDKMYAVFYKKQPYEPFAIPFGFPVLRDINFKEELKKIDQAISRTIENVILLITMGETKTEHGGGINPKAMQAMQDLFANESVGRVLVSDFTTKAQFVIPEIGDILDPKKYQIVNEDIREGLLNILVGSEKFSNTETKAKIFVERLQEGRRSFREEFLQKEINIICKQMGFKSIPKAKHQELDLKDEVALAKVYTRLAELGLLTPAQLNKAIETGVLPEESDMQAAQEKYVEERKKGMYNPLLGGVPLASSPDAEKDRALQKEMAEKGLDVKVQQQKQAKKPAGASNPNATNNGRPATSKASLISVSKFRETIYSVSSLMFKAEAAVKEKFGITELNDVQKNVVTKLTQSVICSTQQADWDVQLAAVLKEPEKHLASSVSNEITRAVDELAAEHKVDSYSAALLYHSRCQQ